MIYIGSIPSQSLPSTPKLETKTQTPTGSTMAAPSWNHIMYPSIDNTLISGFSPCSMVFEVVMVAGKGLSSSLTEFMRKTQNGVSEPWLHDVIDAIGYIYHQGQRLLGNESKIGNNRTIGSMRKTIAWFAHRYLFDCDESANRSPQKCASVLRTMDSWKTLLEKEPLIAFDMACHLPNYEPS